jgi:hypothetical protein
MGAVTNQTHTPIPSALTHPTFSVYETNNPSTPVAVVVDLLIMTPKHDARIVLPAHGDFVIRATGYESSSSAGKVQWDFCGMKDNELGDVVRFDMRGGKCLAVSHKTARMQCEKLTVRLSSPIGVLSASHPYLSSSEFSSTVSFFSIACAGLVVLVLVSKRLLAKPTNEFFSPLPTSSDHCGVHRAPPVETYAALEPQPRQISIGFDL